METEIKKVKLRDSMFATVEYDEIHDATANDEVVKICNNPVTDDLKDAMQALAVHCILICELVDVTKVKSLNNYSPPLLDFVTVKGISVGGDDGRGITISFMRKLSTGRVLNINTPFVKFNDEQVKYKFDYDLQIAFDALVDEVKEYLGGKFGAGGQLAMEFEGVPGADDTNPHL